MPADTFDPAESPATPWPLQLELLELGDNAAAWRAAGFWVSPDKTVQVGGTTIVCTGKGQPFHGWRIQGLGASSSAAVQSEVDGLQLLPAASNNDAVKIQDVPTAKPDMQPHPNGITRIDHIVVSTGNCSRSINAFTAAGFEVCGSRSTTGDRSPVRQTFFWAGDVILELIGPDSKNATNDSPATIFGLAMVTEDLQRTAEVLGKLLGAPKNAVQHGRQIARLRTQTLGIGLHIAVMSPHKPD